MRVRPSHQLSFELRLPHWRRALVYYSQVRPLFFLRSSRLWLPDIGICTSWCEAEPRLGNCPLSWLFYAVSWCAVYGSTGLLRSLASAAASAVAESPSSVQQLCYVLPGPTTNTCSLTCACRGAMASATPSTQERRSEARRTISLLDRTLAGPVASVWANQLHRANSGSLRRVSDHAGDQAARSNVRFTLTKTEDAMDSVLPCVAEELLRPMMQSKFGNPARLDFRYTSHQLQ